MVMKLVYFNVRGLAETSRILLSIGGEEYEDFRYPLEVIDMSKHEMKKEEFDSDKADGKLSLSLNKVPFLEVDGVTIPQSKAIERFLARRFNMMGENELDAARIDSICECVRDFKDEYQKVRKLPDEEKELGIDQWFSKKLVEKMILLDNLLGHEDEKYAVGTKISLADIVLFSFITQFFDKKELALSSTDNLKVKNIINNINTLDEIKDWINKRPDTVF